ncbi:tyrosine-type recombinase/integrase, partial [Actinomycetota bacterium]
HSFRHSFATRLTEKNVNILLVQRLLVHLSLDSTKIYVHFESENFRNAIDFI